MWKRRKERHSVDIDQAILCEPEMTQVAHSDSFLNSVAEYMPENSLSSWLVLDETVVARIGLELPTATEQGQLFADVCIELRSRALLQRRDLFVIWLLRTSRHGRIVIEVEGGTQDARLRVRLISPLRWRIRQAVRFLGGWRYDRIPHV